MIQTNDFTTSESTFLDFPENPNPLDYRSSSNWKAFKDFKDKEILESLCNNFIKLELRVKQLEEASGRLTSYAIPINDLGSAKYKLNSPIYLFISKENDYFLVEAVDFDVYAVGESEKEAVDKFKGILIEYFENLGSSGEKMSKNLKAKYKLLRKLISNEK